MSISKEMWAAAYPASMTAWELSRENKDHLVTGDEKMFYDFEASDYAYFYHNKISEELYDKIKSLEAQKAVLVEALKKYENMVSEFRTTGAEWAAREALIQVEEMEGK